MRRPDRGSASVLLLGVGLAVILVGTGLAAAGGATVARHRAQAAADLAALAGAALVIDGQSAACARAAVIAAANQASLGSCLVQNWDLLVEAQVAWHGLVARAWARAGPVPEEDAYDTPS